MTKRHDWTDLDHAYLEIFGEHPDLSAATVNVTPMRRNLKTYEPGELEICLALDDGTYTPGQILRTWEDAAAQRWMEMRWRPWGDEAWRVDVVPYGKARRDSQP